MQGSRGFRKFGKGAPDNVFCFVYSHQRISQSIVWTSLQKQLDPRGPIASEGVSLPIRLRKPLTTCDFPGVVWTSCSAPSGSANVLSEAKNNVCRKTANFLPSNCTVHNCLNIGILYLHDVCGFTILYNYTVKRVGERDKMNFRSEFNYLIIQEHE